MSTRRTLLLALGATALTAPLRSLAQQPAKVWRIGFLSGSRTGATGPNTTFFLQGMRELGYIEGNNLIIVWRHGENTSESLDAMASELVGLKVEVIVAASTVAVSALQKVTSTIPIIMGSVGDPVASGFVKSLSRPGGNITGLSLNTTDTSTKLLELLQRSVPKLARVAVVVNPDNASHATILANVQAAARQVKLIVLPLQVRSLEDFGRAFESMRRGNAGAVYVAGDTLIGTYSRQVAALCIKYRMPSVFVTRGHVTDGGLISYGQNVSAQYRRAATYVDKILKGAKPGELPVEQPTIFELVINRGTAKALGLAIPQTLLLQADEVIE